MTIDRAIKILSSGIERYYTPYRELEEAFRMGAEALEWTRWIPCSERLPEDNERCFVVRVDPGTRKPFRDISWFKNGDWWNGIYDSSFEITHWMPWPELPEG